MNNLAAFSNPLTFSNPLIFSNRLTPPIPHVSPSPAKNILDGFSNPLIFSNRLTPPTSHVSPNPAKSISQVSQTLSYSQTVSHLPYPTSRPTLQKYFRGVLKPSHILKPSHASHIPRLSQSCKEYSAGFSNPLIFSNRLTPAAPLVFAHRSGPEFQRSIIFEGHSPERTFQHT